MEEKRIEDHDNKMKEKLEKVVDDIHNVGLNANLKNDPINFLHLLIAYLRTGKNKSEEDYGVNVIVASLIYKLVSTMKDDKIKLSKDEIQTFCSTIMADIDIDTI